MKKTIDADSSLTVTISPTTVCISTNPDQSSYANLIVTIENGGADVLEVSGIAITLPPALAPSNALGSITPVAGQPSLWSFGASPITLGEYDATPQSGNNYVNMNAGDTWDFTLQMVTLVSSITQPPSANVTAAVTFEDGSSYSVPLTVSMASAVASIISFNSQPADIDPGDTAVLNWQCEEISYCIISPVNSDEQPASGQLNVSPMATTIYTLYAYGDGVILSAQWGVSVNNPEVLSFGVAGGLAAVDMGSNINLVWKCNQSTASIAISDASGVDIPPLNTGGNTPQVGNIEVGPIGVPTTFTLTAYGSDPDNFDSQEISIGINNVTATLSASPPSGLWIQDEITLNWNITNANAVSMSPAITNGPSLQNLVGSAVYSPGNVTSLQCVLSASGFINDEQAAINNQPAMILEFEPVSITNFTISPATIIPLDGPNQVTLAWNTQAQAVSIDNNVGAVTPVGSCNIDSPDNGAIYVLTAGTNQNPNMFTQSVQVVNAYGPYTVTYFDVVNYKVIPPIIMAVFPVSALAGLSNFLQGGTYSLSFTGLIYEGQPINNPIAGFQVIYTNEDGWCFGITVYSYSQPFRWADPNNPQGTITISSVN